MLVISLYKCLGTVPIILINQHFALRFRFYRVKNIISIFEERLKLVRPIEFVVTRINRKYRRMHLPISNRVYIIRSMIFRRNGNFKGIVLSKMSIYWN